MPKAERKLKRSAVSCIFATLTSLLLPPTAAAQPQKLAAEQLLPATLGPTQLTERRQLQPEIQGIVFRYSNGPGFWATVFVFDAGLKNISLSLTDPIVLFAFAHAENEIKAMAADGRISAARIPDEPARLVKPSPCGREYLRKDIELDVQGGTNASYIALTTVRGKFVKVRLTHLLPHAQFKADAEGFFADLARALGECS